MRVTIICGQTVSHMLFERIMGQLFEERQIDKLEIRGFDAVFELVGREPVHAIFEWFEPFCDRIQFNRREDHYAFRVFPIGKEAVKFVGACD